MANSESGDSVVDRVVRLLEAIPEGSDALQLSELAARAGLPLSTAHRLVRQLVSTAWARDRLADGDGDGLAPGEVLDPVAEDALATEDDHRDEWG